MHQCLKSDGEESDCTICLQLMFRNILTNNYVSVIEENSQHDLNIPLWSCSFGRRLEFSTHIIVSLFHYYIEDLSIISRYDFLHKIECHMQHKEFFFWLWLTSFYKNSAATSYMQEWLSELTMLIQTKSVLQFNPSNYYSFFIKQLTLNFCWLKACQTVCNSQLMFSHLRIPQL